MSPGLEWNVDPVLFHVGALGVRTYSLLFAASFIAGLALFRWQVRRAGVEGTAAAWFALLAFAAVVVGTRLAHLAFYEPAGLLGAPARALDLRAGGLASHGAALALPFAAWLFARWRRVALAPVLDACAMPVALGAALVRLGNFFNGEILGTATTAPWSVTFTRLDAVTARHPVQLYEAGLALAVLGVLLVAHFRLGARRPPWLLSGLLLGLYFGGRVLVECFKDEGRLTAWLTTGQLLSLPFGLAGAALLVAASRSARRASSMTPSPPGTGVSAPSGF